MTRIKRGTVCRWWEPNFKKPKYAVILNVKCPPEPDALFAFSTSQGSFYASKNVEADIIRIPAGKYSFLPLDTILNFRKIYARDFKTLCWCRDFNVEGDLLDDDMRDIDSVLRHSDPIEQVILDLILP